MRAKGGAGALGAVVDAKVLSVLRVFAARPAHDFYLLEIARAARVSPASTLRIIARLVSGGFVERRGISRFKAYRLARSARARALVPLLEGGSP